MAKADCKSVLHTMSTGCHLVASIGAHHAHTPAEHLASLSGQRPSKCIKAAIKVVDVAYLVFMNRREPSNATSVGDGSENRGGLAVHKCKDYQLM